MVKFFKTKPKKRRVVRLEKLPGKDDLMLDKITPFCPLKGAFFIIF
jgi:hypothetical protein